MAQKSDGTIAGDYAWGISLMTKIMQPGAEISLLSYAEVQLVFAGTAVIYNHLEKELVSWWHYWKLVRWSGIWLPPIGKMLLMAKDLHSGKWEPISPEKAFKSIIENR